MGKAGHSPMYMSLSQEESAIDEEAHSQSLWQLQPPKQLSYFTITWVFQSVLFLASCLILYLARYGTINDCQSVTTVWSPAYDDLGFDFDTVRFNGSFDAESRFKGAPNDDIDAAWSEIEDVQPLSISHEQLLKIGAPLDSVEFPDALGGGYMASVEAIHQLHCLNLLREAAYWDYYKTRATAWEDSPKTLHLHIDHCVDLLRQKLMCDADAGLFTFVWVKDYTQPYPIFSSEHKCRSFPDLLEWSIERQAVRDGDDIPKPYDRPIRETIP